MTCYIHLVQRDEVFLNFGFWSVTIWFSRGRSHAIFIISYTSLFKSGIQLEVLWLSLESYILDILYQLHFQVICVSLTDKQMPHMRRKECYLYF